MRDRRKRTVAKAYDRMAGRYLEWARTVTRDPREEIIARFVEALPDDARILDLGCGAGVPSTRELARKFRVVGIDGSKAQIELARRNVPDAEFVHGDFSEAQFAPGSFDGVAALYSISHLPREQHGRLFADIFRWLVPGGLFVATLGATDSPDWLGTWLGEEMFFSSYGAAENRRMVCAAGFETLLDDVLLTREPEGDVSFLWVIARKPSAADTPAGSNLTVA